jgi:WD40 repeat protein
MMIGSGLLYRGGDAGLREQAILPVEQLLLTARTMMVEAGLCVLLLAVGTGVVPRGAPAAASQQPSDRAAAAAAVAPDRSRLNADHLPNDSLPKYARALLGTTRFHSGSSVRIVHYTPDGKSLVSLGDSVAMGAHGIIHFWDVATGRIVRDIGDSKIDFQGIALSPDGKLLATIEYPSRLRLWDVTTGRERRRWHEARDEEYEHLSFSPDGRTIAAGVRQFNPTGGVSESFIGLWDSAARTEYRRQIPLEWCRLWDLKFSSDGKMLATAIRDTELRKGEALMGPDKGSTRLWDLATGNERRRFAVDRCDVFSLAWSPDGKLLACRMSDETVRLHNLTSGREHKLALGQQPANSRSAPQEGAAAPPNRPRSIACLAFSPDGLILAEGTWCGKGEGDFPLADVQIWDVSQGKNLRIYLAHQQRVVALAFAPHGKTLASAGGEPVIRLWDVATGREAFRQSGHRSAIRALAVSPADGTVFSGGVDGTIRHWNPASGRELDLIAQVDGPVEALAVAPNGETLLVAGTTRIQRRHIGGIWLWSVAERREIVGFAPIQESDYPMQDVAFAPDGKTVASPGRISDANSGKALLRFGGQGQKKHPFGNCYPTFYMPDGKQVITAEHDGAWIWDSATGREARRAVHWSNHHDRAALSRDGRFLATRGVDADSEEESDDLPVVLWELASGQEVATLEIHGKSLLRIFSPNGRFLATADGDRTTHHSTIRVWDLATVRELRRFDGHLGRVNALAFTPDGRSLVSGSEDATALVWDVSDLMESLKPDAPLSPESLLAGWNVLADNDACAAYRAAWTFSVPSAVSFLRDHLRPAAEAEPITSPKTLRTLRAIAALERIGTPAARSVLGNLALGNPAAAETREASSTLDRPNRLTCR